MVSNSNARNQMKLILGILTALALATSAFAGRLPDVRVVPFISNGKGVTYIFHSEGNDAHPWTPIHGILVLPDGSPVKFWMTDLFPGAQKMEFTVDQINWLRMFADTHVQKLNYTFSPPLNKETGALYFQFGYE